jgi:hypothetical protein
MAVAEGKTVKTLKAQPAVKQFQRGDLAIRMLPAPIRPYEDALARRFNVVMVGSGISSDVGVISMTDMQSAHTSFAWSPREALHAGEVAVFPYSVSIPVFAGDLTIETHGTTTSREPTWERPAAQRLSNLLALPYDWDSNGSDAPPVAAAVEAFIFLTRVLGSGALPPSVVPLGGGGVQLEWHRRGTDVEVILGQVEDRGIYLEDATGSWEGSVDDSADVAELARRLSEVAAAVDG